jgi:AraC family carnitine catabolism transcriptional activator
MSAFNITLLVTPHFNLATTTAFIDPFRAANYLTGVAHYSWTLVSVDGGEVPCSNGFSVHTQRLDSHVAEPADLVVVSSSWTPEKHHTREITQALLAWSGRGVRLAALDTGTFILARCGLLKHRHATVHYEHLDALSELFPEVNATESLYVMDGDRLTCCGGSAATDFALQIVREQGMEQGVEQGADSIANSAARYLFHHQVRGPEASQNPPRSEPFGQTTPAVLRRAIQLMEEHLENPLTIPQVCQHLQISQRQLSRLFAEYVNKSPVLYYRDIRLDRARCLVTQTDMKLADIAVASGFVSQAHFSRIYSERFGLAPSRDRIEGRVPFEFRAWPMHNPAAAQSTD